MEKECAEKKEKEKPKPVPEEVPAPPKPIPEVAKPPEKPKPVLSKPAENVYMHLKKHGAMSPPQIAKALNMDILTVMKALDELKKIGKVELKA